MRKVFIFIVLMFLGVCVSARETEKLQLLKQSFAELQKSPQDSACQRKFFDAFPKNFPDFFMCFGYSDFSEPLLNYMDYIPAFEKLNYIDIDEKFACLRKIMIGGFLQADGVSMLVSLVKAMSMKDPDYALGRISELTECQQILFWQCYWQNPCNDSSLEKDFVQFYAVPGYNREREVMKRVYESFKGELPVL